MYSTTMLKTRNRERHTRYVSQSLLCLLSSFVPTHLRNVKTKKEMTYEDGTAVFWVASLR